MEDWKHTSILPSFHTKSVNIFLGKFETCPKTAQIQLSSGFEPFLYVQMEHPRFVYGTERNKESAAYDVRRQTAFSNRATPQSFLKTRNLYATANSV